LEIAVLSLAIAAVMVLPGADVSEKVAGGTTAEWTFRARVKDCRIYPVTERPTIGTVYTESAIKESKNGATLVVGFDAHWLLTLAILDHGNDPLGFKHIKTLRLVVHSPSRSLKMDKPKNRQFDLVLSYRINDRSDYSFVGLQVRRPRKSK
jgi:hypothetical protein